MAAVCAWQQLLPGEQCRLPDNCQKNQFYIYFITFRATISDFLKYLTLILEYFTLIIAEINITPYCSYTSSVCLAAIAARRPMPPHGQLENKSSIYLFY